MDVLERYEEVAEDARELMEQMFSDNYRKREAQSIAKHSAAGAAIGAGLGAIPGGIAAAPGALVGAGAGYMLGKARASNRRVRKVARFAAKRKARFDTFG